MTDANTPATRQAIAELAHSRLDGFLAPEAIHQLVGSIYVILDRASAGEDVTEDAPRTEATCSPDVERVPADGYTIDTITAVDVRIHLGRVEDAMRRQLWRGATAVKVYSELLDYYIAADMTDRAPEDRLRILADVVKEIEEPVMARAGRLAGLVCACEGVASPSELTWSLDNDGGVRGGHTVCGLTLPGHAHLALQQRNA